MGRRALVTGATGFVGSHLVERLATGGWQVRALVRETSDTRILEELGIERWTGDLRNESSLRGAVAGVDVVFHLAAATAARDDAGYEASNVEGTVTLAEAIAAADPPPRRLVYVSSYAACGPASEGGPRRVVDTPAPLTAYGRTKLAGEAVAGGLSSRGVEVVVIRAPVVYGPGDRALVPYFRLIRSGFAPVPNGGRSRLHMIYAPDLARMLEAAADVAPGTYAVAGPGIHRWSDVVSAIAEAMGRRPVRISLPAPLVRLAARITQGVGAATGRAVAFNREKAEEMLASAWVCDLTGSETMLPPEQATPLREGISRTVRWYIRRGWL